MTGVIERLPSDGGPSPYGITDEASGVSYVLNRGNGGFSADEGQRITITGTAQDLGAYENLDVADIRAAQYTGPATDPPQSAEPTVSFELDTDCEPPAGTTFFGGAPQQAVGLEDHDSDGVYTGSLTLPEGFYDLGAFAVPVSIQAGTPEDPTQEIKYFGEVVLEDGDAFSASASFCATSGGPGGGSGLYGSAETTTGGVGETTDIAGGTTASAAAGIDLNEDGAVDKADGEHATQASDSAEVTTPEHGTLPAAGSEGVASSAAKVLPSSVANVLPSTGGLVLPIAGVAGLLIVAGGLLVRRISR